MRTFSAAIETAIELRSLTVCADPQRPAAPKIECDAVPAISTRRDHCSIETQKTVLKFDCFLWGT
jgi:hypothetical protein